MNYIQKILTILSKDNKKDFSFIIFLSIVRAFIEVIGIGMLIPMFAFITSNSDTKSKIFNYLPFLENFKDGQIILLFIFFFLFVYLIKTIFVVFLNIYNTKFGEGLYVEISEKLLKKYLAKKFIFFVEKNSANLIRNIASDTNGFAVGTVAACIGIFSNIILSAGICFLLIFYNFHSIFIIIALLIICSLVANLNKKKFSGWAKIRHRESAKMIRKLNEGFGSIKEIILYKKGDYFSDQVKKPLKNFSHSNVYKNAVTSITVPAIELATVSIIFFFFIYLKFFTQIEFSEIITLFSILSFSAIKLLPNFTGILKGFQTLKFNFPAVELIYNDLIKDKTNIISNNPYINNIRSIVFDKVNFRYPNTSLLALKNINLQINSGDKIAIVGDTGSGKTTFINLIAGLLKPSSGNILINSIKNINSKEYPLNVGYVSQSVYLSDDNILANVSLSRTISKQQKIIIKQLLKILNLDNLNYRLGERGSKLSGGQIQRIGIARALYREPTLLILDEATNALDQKIEKKILDFIFKKFDNKTVIFCTHKKKLLKYCNKIIKVKDAQISIIKN